MTKKYYITTPIYYVNDIPHIGHAYTSLACDVLARFKKIDGYDVRLCTGTDEHGQKVAKSALKNDVSPLDFTNKVSKNFLDLLNAMNIKFDDFVRTTEERHKISCQKIWKILDSKGYIYKGKYCGWYCVRDEAYYDENELLEGESGNKIAPTGAEVEWVEEESYFFKLSKFSDKLLDLYNENKDFILPNSRRNEIVNFIKKDGLKDLSISRTNFSWGVNVPNDSKHVMYVWLDALTNYLTSIDYFNYDSKLREFWPADIHIIGKDITRFHVVYWPAFLMAAGIELPKKVFAHGWWTNEGKKISKSLGNVIDPNELINSYGVDQTRYFLIREVPFGADGNFSHLSIKKRINNDLANDLGNLCQRVFSFVKKHAPNGLDNFDFEENDLKIMNESNDAVVNIRTFMDRQKFGKYLETVWKIINDCNKYIDMEAPWKKRKENPERMEVILLTLLETIRKIAILINPIMPETSNKILDMLSIKNEKRMIKNIHDKVKRMNVKNIEILFPKIEN